MGLRINGGEIRVEMVDLDGGEGASRVGSLEGPRRGGKECQASSSSQGGPLGDVLSINAPQGQDLSRRDSGAWGSDLILVRGVPWACDPRWGVSR